MVRSGMSGRTDSHKGTNATALEFAHIFRRTATCDRVSRIGSPREDLMRNRYCDFRFGAVRTTTMPDGWDVKEAR